MKKAKFEWDEIKNQANQKKHHISFEHAQYAFADPCRVIAEDVPIVKMNKGIIVLVK